MLELLAQGLKLQKEWSNTFKDIHWYEKLVFGNGALLLFKYPYGIGAYSANSLEDFNRVLKGIEKNHTFSGLSSYSIQIPNVGEDYVPLESPFDFVSNEKTILGDDVPLLFPESKEVPLSKEFISKLKTEILIVSKEKSIKSSCARNAKYTSDETETFEERITKTIPEDIIQDIKNKGAHKKGTDVKPHTINGLLKESEKITLFKLLEYYLVKILSRTMYPIQMRQAKEEKKQAHIDNSDANRNHKTTRELFRRVYLVKNSL